MPDHVGQSNEFESWLRQFDGDVAKRGLATVCRERISELAEWHKRGGDVGGTLWRILRNEPEIRTAVERRGAVAARAARPAAARIAPAGAKTATLPGVVESNGTPVLCFAAASFSNWGRTVQNTPAITAVPKTKTGVCNLVKWATANGKSVRASGYRHTWGDLYSGDGEVLISTLPLDVVEDLPASEPPIDPSDELQGITVVGTIKEGGVTKALCKIGAGTTNEQFRRWCLDPNGGALTWTVPLNVIMVEITWGGSNAPICHGAGLRNATLSDLVAAIEFVNPKGALQTVSDPALLKAASGAFGLMGIVTAVTLKLDPMSYANMKPLKQRIALTVPPPAGFPVPPEIDMSGITPADLKAAVADFVDRCANHYYAEWFWFTFQPEGWINTWKNDGAKADAKDYPGDLASLEQALEEYAAGLMVESSLFNDLPEFAQALALGSGAMALLPSGDTIVTPLIDGLHFRRGIQNMRVLDMELEIPIPSLANDPTKPDWTICQQAWWAAIAQVYETFRTTANAPMRLTLEMRIMAGSGVTLAPQYGNDLGTCSIEVLTTLNTDPKEWAAFMQAVADRWFALRDAKGGKLDIRPHWAKQWQGLTAGGVPIADHLRTVAYKDRIPEFGASLKQIAAAGGYTMADMQARFANPLLSSILGAIYT